MKSKIEFKIESLLTGIENPKGKIELVLFAKKTADYEGLEFFNSLAQVKFTDPQINKVFPGGVPLDETLLIGSDRWNGVHLLLCIRSGKSCCRIATVHSKDRKIEFHEDYEDAILLKKLSKNDIKELFSYVWDNLELIRPKPGSLDDLD